MGRLYRTRTIVTVRVSQLLIPVHLCCVVSFLHQERAFTSLLKSLVNSAHQLQS